jgi:Fe-S-cluster containining protein
MVHTLPICLQCIEKQRSCCEDVRVPLLIEDIDRILAKGHKLEDFAIAGEYPPEDRVGWWAENMIEIDGKLFKPNIKEIDGKCVFQQNGCIIGKDRPLICRMYPFWAETNEVLYEADEEKSCYFGKCGSDIEQGLRHTGETKESILDYMARTKADCKRVKEHERIIIKLIKAGNIQYY